MRKDICTLAALTGLAAVANATEVSENPYSVRGVVRAESAAILSSELVARIASLPFRPGQAFAAGDVLITFDCRRYEADLRAAEAEAETTRITAEMNRQLLRHRAAGASDLAIAEAKHGQALAAIDGLRVRTSQCVIKAPYDGRVVERSVDVFEMPQANAPLMKIVKSGPLEIDIFVPSRWTGWLRPGHRFEFAVEETATRHQAEVLELGAVVDPISRTMKIAAKVVGPADNLRPGMSGAALIAPAAAGAIR